MAANENDEFSEEALEQEFNQPVTTNKKPGVNLDIINRVKPLINKSLLWKAPVVLIIGFVIYVVLFNAYYYYLSITQPPLIIFSVPDASNCTNINADYNAEGTANIQNIGCDEVNTIRLKINGEIKDVTLDEPLQPGEEVTLSLEEGELVAACGDGVCDAVYEEDYLTCTQDCPNCKDNNPTTINYYDYNTQTCITRSLTYTELYKENFTTSINYWEDVYESNAWNTINDKLVLNSTGNNKPKLYLTPELSRGYYSLKGSINLEEGNIAINVIKEVDTATYNLTIPVSVEYYTFSITNNGIVLFKEDKEAGTVEVLDDQLKEIIPGASYDFEIITIDETLLFNLDDETMIHYESSEDLNTYHSYSIELKRIYDEETSSYNYKGLAYFDDLTISQLN